MQDGTALYPTLVAENLDPASPFYGALDMKRAALHGYSMGAGNTLRILAANPGYSCGFVHAPTSSAATAAPNIRVPFASVHGQGDTTASPNNSANLFNNSNNFTGTKTIYLFNTEVDHSNIISDALHRPPDAAVWARVRSVFLGFYETYLHGNAAGLEDVVGLTARAEPRPRGALARGGAARCCG
jgi:dienelactone hydrolase